MLKLIRSVCLQNYSTSFHAAVLAQTVGSPRMSSLRISHSSGANEDSHHLRRCAQQIFDAGVEAVLPSQMVKGQKVILIPNL